MAVKKAGSFVFVRFFGRWITFRIVKVAPRHLTVRAKIPGAKRATTLVIPKNSKDLRGWK